MDAFLEVQQLNSAVRCTNTIERLEGAHTWMLEHLRQLQQESEKINQELRDCGEECTDLW
jgi:hypothetical protein